MSAPGDVFAALRTHLPHLYAVVDPATAPEVLGWLHGSGLAYQCLFQGDAAARLAEEAPYLVHLSEAPALRELVATHHDQDAVIYLVSRAPFYVMRRHLRRIQYVETEAGETLYFRFYDPRVARVFLPTCDETQLRWVFGDVVSHWLTAADEPNRLLDMHVVDDAVTADRVVS